MIYKSSNFIIIKKMIKFENYWLKLKQKDQVLFKCHILVHQIKKLGLLFIYSIIVFQSLPNIGLLIVWTPRSTFAINSKLGTIGNSIGGIGNTVVTVLTPSVIVFVPTSEIFCQTLVWLIYSVGDILGVTVSIEVTLLETIWLALSL